MDFIFLEFYIKKKYDQSVEEYFGIGKQSVSSWRTSNEIPPKRLIEFNTSEGTLNIKELFDKLY